MTTANARDEGSRSEGASPDAPSRRVRWAPLALALLVLVGGGFGLFVRHAPATTWAVPITPGPLTGDRFVWEIGRAPGEIRVDVGTRDGERATVRIVDRLHPDHAAGEVASRNTRLLPDGSRNRAATADEVDALAARVRAWEQRQPPPPRFVAPVGHKASPLQHAEQIVLEGLIVLWLAGLVATVRAWWPRGRPWWMLGPLAAIAVLHLILGWEGIGGVWHSNQHGYDRVADVVQQTPPAFAALGLLHGYGYYAVFQPLAALTGLDPIALSPWVASATLVALFAWLWLLWDDLAAACLGAVLLAAVPTFLRLSASEDMYVPTALWVVATLALLERYLRDDRDRWLLLALPPAFLAMQTRAEMIALVPLWCVLLVVVRKPGWIRTAPRRPAVVVGLLTAALLFVPRLVELRASPPPADLRRASLDPFRDARLVLVGALLVVGIALVPVIRARLRRLPRLVWVALGVGLVALAAAWASVVLPSGGPLEHTGQIHPLLDPDVGAPGVVLVVVIGAVVGARARPARVAWLVLSFTVGLLVYLPQYDCLSTYVRTSLATWPFLVALAAPVTTLPATRVIGVAVVALLIGTTPTRDWLTLREAKQLQWDQVAQVDATLPADAVLVWLSDADVAPDARQRGFRTTRARLDHWLPERRVFGLDAWRRGEVPEGTPTFFVRTADCHRVLFQPRGSRALAGDVEVGWRYLDVSRVSTDERVIVDVPEGWMDPRCAAALQTATETLSEVPLPRSNAGSIYETLLGEPALGLYRIPSRP